MCLCINSMLPVETDAVGVGVNVRVGVCVKITAYRDTILRFIDMIHLNIFLLE